MRRLLAPLVVLATLQVLDLWTTHAAFEHGAVEGNPVTALALVLGGFLALSALKVAAVSVNVSAAVLNVRAGHGARAVRGICIVSMLYCGVVLSNLLHVV